MSEQTEIKSCCVTGHIHEGQPLGSFEVLHGVRTYVSNPKPSTSQNIVVFITDIFGADLNNVKLLADEWAGGDGGFKVLVPDFLTDGAISHEHLSSIVPTLKQQSTKTVVDKAKDTAIMGANIGPFLVRFREANIKPEIEKFVSAVRADAGTKKIIAVGFCWGARYALLLSQNDSPAKVDVCIANHPSFVTESDLTSITDTPVAIFKGTEDAMLSDDDLKKFESILSKNLGDKLYVKLIPDAVHGFTVRGDDNEPREKGFKEDAANEGIKFAQKWVSGA